MATRPLWPRRSYDFKFTWADMRQLITSKKVWFGIFVIAVFGGVALKTNLFDGAEDGAVTLPYMSRGVIEGRQGEINVAVPESDRRQTGSSTVRPTNKWYAAQTDDIKASMILGMGTDFNGFHSLHRYFMDLQHRIDTGDQAAAEPAAQLIRRCRLSLGDNALENLENPTNLIAKVCATLPGLNAASEIKLIADAARQGNVPAILAEFGFPPPNIVYSEDLGVRREWASSVAGRLSVLAASGSVDAAWELARAYLSDEYGLRDLTKSGLYYRQVVDHVTDGDYRKDVAKTNLGRICATGNLSDGYESICK